MAMENYSPSHPTDEVDLDNSPNDIQLLSESIGKSKFSESIEQPQVFEIIDRNIELTKNSESSNLINFPYTNKKSPSKSPELRRMKSRSKSRSKSKRRRSKSRSRNRRSRSRNRGDRSFHRDRDYGRNSDKRSHSRERRSRSKERKPRSNEKRSRSRERRSRSRNSSKYNSMPRDSPNQFRSKEKKNDNIFSKMNELSSKNPEPTVKQKWHYDSDEETAPTKRSESITVIDSASRYDDMKQSNFNDNSNKNEDVNSFPRRNDFHYRRGGNDNFRGNQRNRQWEPRNSGRSNFGSRNDQRFNRNNSNFNNKDDDNLKWNNNNKNEENYTNKRNWEDDKKDENTGAWDKGIDNNDSQFEDVQDTKGFAADSDEEFGSWGNENKKSINEMLTAANLASQKKPNQFKDDNQDLQESKNNPNQDSDEEFGAWGSEQKTKKVVNELPQNRKEMFNNTNLVNNTNNDSDEEFGSWGKDRSSSRPSNSNDNQSDSFNQPHQQFHNQNQRQNFNRNNDGNPRFQGRRGGNNNFNRFQRPNNQDRFNSNNNFNTNNNFNNNPPNFNNFNNPSNNMLNPVQPPQQQTEMLSQMPIQIPPYNFNPTQRPPQWPPMNNMNFPPMCNNGQMPFNPLPILPQMQFSQINQQPPMSMPNLMQQPMSYIPPPPPSTHPIGITNSSQSSNNFNPPPIQQQQQQTTDNNNLLETIMTNVGLSSKSIRLQSDIFKPQPPQLNKSSVNDSLHNIIKSAASTVLSRLVESSQKSNANNLNSTTGNISDSMSMSPPSPSSSPPPPAKQSYNMMSNSENSDFILPPLPNYSDVLKTSANISNNNINQLNVSTNASGNHNKVPSSSEISEDKRNRSDFESKGDWMERIALEVKNFLRPAYMSKKITKSDYKEIMKRCVTKISRSGVTEINTEKIEKFVLSYVDKYQKFRRGKQHGVVSSSEHELVM